MRQPARKADEMVVCWCDARGIHAPVRSHVFGTKRREAMIDDAFAEELHPFLGGIACDLRCTPHTIGGMPDHVHLLIRYRTDISIADLVRHPKGRSSKWTNERKPGSLK